MPITIAVCYRIGLTQGISRQTMLLSVQKIPICCLRIGIVMVMNDDRRLLCVLGLLLTGSALLGLFLHFLLDACEFAVNHDTTAIFAYDNLLVHLDIYLALWWNLVVATATGITLLYDDTETGRSCGCA